MMLFRAGGEGGGLWSNGWDTHTKWSEKLVVSLIGVKIKDSGLTSGVHDETPLFLAPQVSFRVLSKK